jgi:hypothetical protein
MLEWRNKVVAATKDRVPHFGEQRVDTSVEGREVLVSHPAANDELKLSRERAGEGDEDQAALQLPDAGSDQGVAAAKDAALSVVGTTWIRLADMGDGGDS